MHVDSAHKNVKACRRHYVPLPHRVFHIPEKRKKTRTITVICRQLYSVLTHFLLTDVLL